MLVHRSTQKEECAPRIFLVTRGAENGLRSLCFKVEVILPVALVLSAVYSVPSTWRLVSYALVFVGPSILFAACSLTVASTFARALSVQLIAAFAGSLSGLAVGFVIVVYVPGVW